MAKKEKTLRKNLRKKIHNTHKKSRAKKKAARQKIPRLYCNFGYANNIFKKKISNFFHLVANPAYSLYVSRLIAELFAKIYD